LSIYGTTASAINSVANQPDSGSLSTSVIGAIKNAAAKTGVDFSYLLKKATQESGLDPTAKAATSSATGLFQFTNQTWLQMVKNDGAKYGLGAYASQIATGSNGHLSISDPAAKQAILALRTDPTVSSEMAGELDKQNAASLQQNVGGKVGDTELYLAHFLGAGGASDFLNAMHANPNASAASVVPDAASSNNAVFYTKSGQPRTLAQIYQHFADKFSGSSATTQIASTTATTPVSTGTTSLASTTTAAATYAAATSSLPFVPRLMQVARMYGSSAAVASPEAMPASGSTAQVSTSGPTTSGPSTLFTAMVLGQMNGKMFDPTSPLNADTGLDAKKKNTLFNLSSAA
jgi:hypothetical protein